MKRFLPLTALLLAGCDLAPHYRRPTLPAPPGLPSGGTYPLAADAATAAPDIAWQDFFVDPALRQVIATGLVNNRDLRIALGNIEQARAQYRIQRADLLPTIGLNASLTKEHGPGGFSGATVPTGGTGTTSGTGTGTTGTGSGGTGTGGTGTGGTGTGTTGTGTGGTGTGSSLVGSTGSSTTTIYSVNAGFSAFEIDLFGRVRNLTKAALEQYLATEEGARSTRISLVAEIASAYLTYAADQDQLTISRNTLESFRNSLELTQAQFRIGVISELEVRQAQTLFEQARYDIAALQTQIARDKNALDLLVGAPVAPELLPNALGEHAFTLADLPAGLSSDVLLRRPDVLQAEHGLKAQYANIGAARAAFFPQISLTAAVGTISGALSGLFDHGSFTWEVAPSASLPIFDFGRNAANLKYAKASRDVALATYERAIQTGFREVADALAERGTINEQLKARSDRADAANVAYRLSDARYRAGVDPFLNTLDSQRTLYAAQQDLTQTRLEAASNIVELYRALGGGLRSNGDDGTPAVLRDGDPALTRSR